jgi:superfamily I DNA/RNA helicase
MQRNTDDPEIILTTAHKSKGREWDVVWLASDFPSNWNNKGEWVGLRDEERNLLYVAVTRARKHLIYNDTVRELIERTGEHMTKEDAA